MEAFKFLDDSATTVMTEFRWPLPVGPEPGPWVEVAEVRPCRAGVHACAADHLSYWISDRLWTIELDGPVEEGRHKVVARRGRLLRQVRAWHEGVSEAFVTDVVWRTRDRVVSVLARSGERRLAERLAAASSLGELAELESLEGELGPAEPGIATAVLLAADCAYEAEHSIAASAPYVAACAAGHLALAEGSDPGGYAEAFETERLRQSRWIAQRVR